MSAIQSPRRNGRSFLALLAGFVAVVVLSLGTDMALRAAGIMPRLGESMSDGLFLLATAYRIIYGVLGSYITARLAPYQPMQHALIGGAVGLVLNIAGAAATWNHQPSLGPHWYPVALILTAIPCAWLGGKFYLMQLQSTSGRQVTPESRQA